MSSKPDHQVPKAEQSSTTADKSTPQASHDTHAAGSGHAPAPTVQLEQHAQPHQELICGGIGNARSISEEELKVWEMYKPHLEKKIRAKFNVPAEFVLKPVQVSTQVVAGMNYFFTVELPNKKYAAARVYHVPWQANTHGREEQVGVHEKLLDSPSERVGHF